MSELQQTEKTNVLGWGNLGFWHDDTRDFRVAWRDMARELAGLCPQKKLVRLVSYGCGRGAELAYFQEIWGLREAIGIDADLGSIELAKALWQRPGLFFNQADAMDYVPRQDYFDAAIILDGAKNPSPVAKDVIVIKFSELGFSLIALITSCIELYSVTDPLICAELISFISTKMNLLAPKYVIALLVSGGISSVVT